MKPLKTTITRSYEFESTITYTGEENPGEHYFKIVRKESEGLFNEDEDECFALVEHGQLIGWEGYTMYPEAEEIEVMEEFLRSKKII